jgi:hypothetical protein
MTNLSCGETPYRCLVAISDKWFLFPKRAFARHWPPRVLGPLIVRRLIGGFALAFDLRESLDLARLDLTDAMLDDRSVDFFGILTIANLAIDADELAFLQSLRKA